MKNRIYQIIIAVLIVACAALAFMWRAAESDMSDVKLLAQAGASDACEQFCEFRDTGEQSSWQYAVGSFRSFMQAYHLLTEGSSQAANYTFCNEVYGAMVLDPERSMAHIDEIIETMTILAGDVTSPSGHALMSDLRNLITD